MPFSPEGRHAPRYYTESEERGGVGGREGRRRRRRGGGSFMCPLEFLLGLIILRF
jgi:hypothetical protein